MTPYQGRHTKLQTYTTESFTPGYFLRQKQQPAKESQQSIIKILHRPTYHKLVNMLMTLLHSNSMLGRNGGSTADQKLLQNLPVTLDIDVDIRQRRLGLSVNTECITLNHYIPRLPFCRSAMPINHYSVGFRMQYNCTVCCSSRIIVPIIQLYSVIK